MYLCKECDTELILLTQPEIFKFYKQTNDGFCIEEEINGETEEQFFICENPNCSFFNYKLLVNEVIGANKYLEQSIIHLDTYKVVKKEGKV